MTLAVGLSNDKSVDILKLWSMGQSKVSTNESAPFQAIPLE
jgi:hypothetical protein